MSTKVTSVQYQTHYTLWLACLLFAVVCTMGMTIEIHHDHLPMTLFFAFGAVLFFSLGRAIRTRGLSNRLHSVSGTEIEFTLDEIDPADFQDSNVVTIDD